MLVRVHGCVCVCIHVCEQTHFKGREKKDDTKPTDNNNNNKQKKNPALDSTIAFLSKVSERGKLESTIMHGAHNGLTNCSFVSENTTPF